VYPNPAKDKLTVSIPEDAQLYKISLINNLGQTLLQTNFTTIDVSGIANGFYFLNITTTNFKVNKKVVINH
jgi:aminopeptidase YwaD